ncbi:hypothetical protein M3Y95_00829100 [Aphelenchoides besseyi]|nr:hypothetical protein M3Y95_00829100 [Aphelenchoides besseyi]
MLIFFSLLFLLIQPTHLLPLASSDDPCPDFDVSFNVTEFSFGSYKSVRYHRGQYFPWDNIFFLPLAPFQSVVDQLNAQVADPVYQVKCDNQSLATYPDLSFTVNGTKLVAHSSDYVALELISEGSCPLMIDYDADATSDFDYGLPSSMLEQLCQAEK